MSGRQIRVLHVGLSNNLGGIENVVRSWNSVLPENIRFDFVSIGGEPIAFQDEFEINGARVFNICARSENPLKSYQQLSHVIKENKFDFIQHHMMSFSWPEPLYIAQRTTNMQAIAHCHTAGSKNLSCKYRLLDSYGRWKLSRKPYLKIACGNVAGEDMFHADDFEVIHNGVDFASCTYREEKRICIRKQLNISLGAFVIGHVGRSGDAKNYPFVLKLFSDYLKINSNSVLMLIGNVKDDEKVRMLIRQEHLDKNVVFTGVLSDIKDYYSAMDVFILPSLYEGVSVAMIEAQVSGLTCIVSNFVPEDADISGNVRYIPIDSTKQGIIELSRTCTRNRDIASLNLDFSLDLKTTAKKMFEFYETHIK